MRNFIFHSTETLEESLVILDEYGDEAQVIAGGTAMVALMKQSLISADHLVSLHNLRNLRYIRIEENSLHIGTLTTHRDVELSEVIREYVPALVDVYKRVATIRIRNQATIGGGLAHADPAQDPPPVLLVLDARVRLMSTRGERVIPLTEFFLDYYETVIGQGEVLTELIVPVPKSKNKIAYIRYSPRTADDYPTISVAVHGRFENGQFQEVKLAVGAAASTPILISGIAEVLNGRELTANLINQAAGLVADQVDPLSDSRGSADYKRDMAVVVTTRALEQVLGSTK